MGFKEKERGKGATKTRNQVKILDRDSRHRFTRAMGLDYLLTCLPAYLLTCPKYDMLQGFN